MTNPATDFSGTRLSTPVYGIPYKLEKQTLDVEENSSSASETIIMRTSDIVEMIAESFPPPTWTNGYWFPGRKRHMPGNGYLLSRRLRFESIDTGLPSDFWQYDSGAPSGTYESLCRCTIEYATGQDQDEVDPADPTTFLEHTVTAGGEFLIIPPSNTNWGENGETENKSHQVPITKILPTLEHTLRWSYVRNPPWTTIRNQLGTLNNATLGIFNDAPAETVMFMSIQAEQRYTTTGVKPWSIDYKFSERNITDNDTDGIGWNYAYNPAEAKFVRLKRKLSDGTLVDLYDSSPFQDLFKGENV